MTVESIVKDDLSWTLWSCFASAILCAVCAVVVLAFQVSSGRRAGSGSGDRTSRLRQLSAHAAAGEGIHGAQRSQYICPSLSDPTPPPAAPHVRRRAGAPPAGLRPSPLWAPRCAASASSGTSCCWPASWVRWGSGRRKHCITDQMWGTRPTRADGALCLHHTPLRTLQPAHSPSTRSTTRSLTHTSA